MVYTENIVEMPGGVQIVSVITKESAEAMKIAKGKEMSAVIKASHVMLAIDCEAWEGTYPVTTRRTHAGAGHPGMH